MGKRIVLTGLSRESLQKVLKRHRKAPFCFLCKRQEGEKTVYLVDGDVGVTDLQVFWLEITEDDLIFRFPICQECELLAKALAMKLRGRSDWGTLERRTLH